MSSLFQPVTTTQSTLESAAVVNGKAYFVQDTEKLFFDYGNTRTEIRDIIILEHEADRELLLAPKNKFYFVIDTAVLWLYRLGSWIQVNGSGSSNLAIASQSYNAGSGIASVQLDQAIPDASCIIGINIDGALLLRSSYSLGSDKKTINFNEALNVESGIDVIYTISNSAVESQALSSVVYNETQLDAGNVYSIELDSNKQLTLSGWTNGQQGIITVYLTVASNSTLTLDFPNNIKWKNGIEPNLEVGKSYILEFKSIDAGLTIYGSVDSYI